MCLDCILSTQKAVACTTVLCAILSVYVCNYIIRQYVSAVNIKVSSYVVLPKNNRKGMVCATFSMLKQAKSKVDFIETMWQKTSRGQSPSAWKCFRLCGLRLCKTAVW